MTSLGWRDECPFETTYELFEFCAREYDSQPAITFIPDMGDDAFVQQQSYSELFSHITQATNLFHSLGVDRDAVVSLVLPSLFESHELIWGAETCGIANPINPFLETEIIVKLLATAKSRVLVTCLPIEGFNLFQQLLDLADQLPDLQAIVIIEPPNPLSEMATLPTKTDSGKPIVRYIEARNAQSDNALAFADHGKRDDLASLFHTGGTTGVPKLAPHTFENEVFTAWTLKDLLDIQPGEVSLVGLPLFHVNAVILSGLTCFLAGANIVLATPLGYREKAVVANIWNLIESYSISMMSGVATVYVAAMSIEKGNADISSLRLAIVGAAPLSPDVFNRFTDYTGVKLLEGYGLTESTVAASFNPLQGERKVGSVGRKLPNTELKTAQINGDKISHDCATGEIGSVLIRGPHIFPGYYNHPDSGLLGDGWLDTGDLGRIDNDGYLWLTGRSKDIIIRGGHNIDPTMIEDALIKHPSVALAAAVGQPDTYAGEVPIAYVQLQEGSDTAPEKLHEWCRQHVPERAAIPARIEVLEQLPVTAVGKLFKPPLRRNASRYVVEKTLSEAGINAQVDVVEDAQQGQLVRVKSGDPDAASNRLGDFALNFQFE